MGLVVRGLHHELPHWGTPILVTPLLYTLTLVPTKIIEDFFKNQCIKSRDKF